MVKWLLNHGANPSARSIDIPGEPEGLSPLHVAVLAQHREIAKVLIESNSDLNAVMSNGFSPLMCATEIGDMQMVRLLVEAGAKLNVLNETGASPIANAVSRGDAEMVEYLVQHGARLTTMDKQKMTLLMQAAFNKAVDVVRFLINANVPVDEQNVSGETALHNAVLAHAVRHTEFDLERKAVAPKQDNLRDVELVLQLLIEAGADRTIRDNEGLTALDYAKKMRALKLVQLLESSPP